MKHSLKIRVSNDLKDSGVVACKSITLREKILTKLLGSKQKVLVLVPGDTVESIAIAEIEEGGMTDGKNVGACSFTR